MSNPFELVFFVVTPENLYLRSMISVILARGPVRPLIVRRSGLLWCPSSSSLFP